MEPTPPTWFLRLTTVAWGLLGLAGALPAMFAVMMLDAPGSEDRWATWALVIAVMSFPMVCLIAITESWKRYRARDYTTARYAAMLPLINLVVALAASAWISVFQNGRFAG